MYFRIGYQTYLTDKNTSIQPTKNPLLANSLCKNTWQFHSDHTKTPACELRIHTTTVKPVISGHLRNWGNVTGFRQALHVRCDCEIIKILFTYSNPISKKQSKQSKHQIWIIQKLLKIYNFNTNQLQTFGSMSEAMKEAGDMIWLQFLRPAVHE